jgi:hypothetical protein
MDVSALDIPNVTEPSGADDRLDVACGATYMRMLYEYIPVSPVRILSTLTSSYYAHALQLIEETSDVISKEEAHEVLCIIGVIIKSSPESVAYKARLVSRTAVFELDGKMFIKGLRPVGS